MRFPHIIKAAKATVLGCFFWAVTTACVHHPLLEAGAETRSERDLIEAVLMDYIDGTSVENPDQLRSAFHPDFNLYSVNNDGSLRVWSGTEYISNFKLGDVNSREGRIISIDFEKDVAVAKAEIIIPGSRIFTDYFLLSKYDGNWKIIHKSYTFQRIESD